MVRREPAEVPDEQRARAELDAAYLAAYRADAYPRPAVATDLVILTVLDEELQVLLIRRGIPPFPGAWALPGGFVRVGPSAPGDLADQGEDVDAAARRELQEETGLDPARVHLEQLQAFGRPGRDPRMRVISVAYFALVRPELAGHVQAGTDAAWASFVPVREALQRELAFDHREILETALARVRGGLFRRPYAVALVPEVFSVSELRRVYEIIGGEALDRGNFTRRVQGMVERGVLEEAEGRKVTGARRARVYRFRG